jgi:redox-sensitive bicupin YhaK (pirin superfamily)
VPIVEAMIAVRRGAERGRSRFDWLDSRHTFSFAEYHDARHMGFRTLRVINEDRVAPGRGFGTHMHRDMEIVTWVLSGALEHRDSLGSGSVIRPGEVQRMSAGRGVAHSEYNASENDPVHFLQIWILPESRDLAASYEQKRIPAEEMRRRLRPIVARDAREGAVAIHQDATILATRLEAGELVEHALAPGRHAWVQVASGSLTLDGEALKAGDGAAVSDAQHLTVTATVPGTHALVFDLA